MGAGRQSTARPSLAVNECLYRHLERQCLIVDRHRKRAYFPRTQSGPREIAYRASFHQAKRTVTRPFVSRETERVLYWEHEAIWFGFESFGNTWALRILPGYVFTTDGEQMLLHHTRVGALAPKKATRDYNLQVHNASRSRRLQVPRGKGPSSLSASATKSCPDRQKEPMSKRSNRWLGY
jgi:hypothetical protein